MDGKIWEKLGKIDKNVAIVMQQTKTMAKDQEQDQLQIKENTKDIIKINVHKKWLSRIGGIAGTIVTALVIHLLVKG